MKSSTLTKTLTPPETCSFCGLGVYANSESGMHPCCLYAKRAGEPFCFGCENFRRRWERGETCPHVDGVDKNTGKPKRACCRP